MRAGYSKRTLVEKLGIKKGNVLILNPPYDYDKLLGKLPAPVNVIHSLDDKTFNFIQYFVTSQEALKEMFSKLKGHLTKSGMLWISWPKSSCTWIGTDLNENIIRDIGLKEGLVDVKVIAVNEAWSGLKFVYRLKDR